MNIQPTPKHLTGNHKSTGPKTRAGKQRSSRNALQHGATSPELLDESERLQYKQLVQELQAYYPSKNPLVGITIKRIAHLTVHQDRIFQVIDSRFRISRTAKSHFEMAGEILNLTEPEMAQAAKWVYEKYHGQEPELFADPRLHEIGRELRAVDHFDLLTTHQEFEQRLPTFCAYICSQATENQQTLGDYLATKQIDRSSLRSKSAPNNPAARSPSRPVPPPQQAFDPSYLGNKYRPLFDQDMATLHRAAYWFRRQSLLMLVTNRRLEHFTELVDIVGNSMTPEQGQLESLIRYQTNISRQLGQSIGQLLALAQQDVPHIHAAAAI